MFNAQSNQYREWQVPIAIADEKYRLGWLDESVEEGQAWLRAQRGYPDMRKAIEILSGSEAVRRDLQTSRYRSRLNTNPLKRDVREVVGTLGKLRPMWGYHSDNKDYSAHAEMMNKITRAIYLERFFDLRIKDALRWSAATARGWAVPTFRRKMCGTGPGVFEIFTYGAPSVLPNQLPSSGDWQEAYAVHILDEMPVYMAHGIFPAFQDRLRPSQSRYWYASDNIRRAAQGNWMRRAFNQIIRGPDTEGQQELLVPIRRSYIVDLSINITDKPIPMGEPGTSWSYVVPYLGQELADGRKANENDARLYPYRRCIISSDNCIMYDGPGFDWHGMFPGVSFCLDAWPWEPLGFSLVHEGFELNEAIKDIDRGNMDKARALLNIPLTYDTNATSRREAESVDPLMPHGRYGIDGTASEAPTFRPIVEMDFYKIDPSVLELRNMFKEDMHAQLAIHDIMSLAKLRAVGSMDEVEKIVEANGPIVEDMSRSMEPPIRELGEMLKYSVLQYMNTARVIQYVGEDGVTPETFDFKPDSLVPSHITGESTDKASTLDIIQRARIFADNLRFFILPNTLHEMQQMQMKLILIQLRKAGVMIDSQTIAEACAVPNYGKIDGNTVIERYQREREMQLEEMAKMKEIATVLGLGTPGGNGAGGGKPSGGPEGRPNSMSAPPKLSQKDNGTRSTITTSK
jgi:hypothetical protein